MIEQNQLDQLIEIEEEVNSCTRCKLFQHRTKTVPGAFPENHKKILFVANCPGAMEDIIGKPFVDILAAPFTQAVYEIMDLTRDDYCISYCVKCAPPLRNHIRERLSRNSLFWCSEYLFRQIEIIDPILVISMGYVPLVNFLFRKSIDFKINRKLEEIKSSFVGFPYEFKSILSDKKYLMFQTYNYKSWLASKERYEKSLIHFDQIRRILNDIKAGKSRADILRNSPILK